MIGTHVPLHLLIGVVEMKVMVVMVLVVFCNCEGISDEIGALLIYHLVLVF